MKIVGRSADPRGKVKETLLDPDDTAKRDAERYRLLQAAARWNCATAPWVASLTFLIGAMVKSADPRIDPFAVLSNEQIEQVLRAAEGGTQYTPVDSIATVLMPVATSQLAMR